MLTLLPPIGKLDISGAPRGIACEMNDTRAEEKQPNDAHFDVKQQIRPRPSKTSSSDHQGEPAQLSGEMGAENPRDAESTEKEPKMDAFAIQQNEWSDLKYRSMTVGDVVEGLEHVEKVSDRDKSVYKIAAETQPNYEQGQLQKLSFEDELTFIPKLNALSLKIAQSRTSVANRIKVSCENRVAALEEEMAQNFTFKPCISENSVKIADRLKTDFWTRQKLHTEKQRRMLEAVQSTWHQKSSSNSFSKQSESLNENMKDKATAVAFAEPIYSNDDSNGQWEPDWRADFVEHISHPKTIGKLSHKQKKNGPQEIPPKKLESLKPRALKKLEQRRLKSEKVQRSLDDTAIHFKRSDSELCSPNNHSSNTLSTSTDLSGSQKASGQSDKGQKSKATHKRSKTMPLNNVHVINRPFIADPARFLQTKSSAEEALRNKKVFICMGPYPVLRACLRRRGWIEKYFKADIACSNLAKDRSPNKFSRDSDDDDDDDDGQDEAGNSMEKEAKETHPLGSCCENTAPCRPSNFEKKGTETKSGYIYGNTKIGNFEELDQGFESDSQYGIMSRIARNAVPTLIWTCRRSDIEFNYLHKDQIVNHFVHASSFTTKFGICVNIRNVPFFESVDPDSFFPRCHRLSSDNERQDFIDEFRMLSAIAILRYTVTRLNDEENLTTKNINRMFIPTGALLLAMKACQGYLRSKQHCDTEEEQKFNQYGLSEEKWIELVEFFYQLSSKNSTITGAECYKGECEKILRQMEEAYPQCSLHKRNIWIIKPGAKSRGRGILVMDNLQEILRLASGSPYVPKRENRWVVQKYIERPLLIYNTKFDIRQWFLVTDWNPFTLWFYKDCYLRFCSQEFTLSKFDPEYHLANNSIQKDYTNGPRSEHLPADNMWTKDQYISYLREQGYGEHWTEVIYPSMKKAIVYTLLACQDSLEYRKNSFELYGADFMISEDMRPWLIEINCSPAMGASTPITKKLCAEVIEDTLKVVLDRREHKSCDTGKFELAYKQQYIPIPVYTGSNLIVEGEGCRKSIKASTSPQQSTTYTVRPNKPKEAKESKDDDDPRAKKTTLKFLSPKMAKKLPRKRGENSDEYTMSRNSIISTKLFKKEATISFSKRKKENPMKVCSPGKEEKCPVVSGYHVQNASLEVSIADCNIKHAAKDGPISSKALSQQTLKLARMKNKAKKKIGYATLMYHKANDGPGLSISPGHGVTQI